MLQLRKSFASSYQTQLIDDPELCSLKCFSYPGAVEDGVVTGIYLEIHPAGASPWMACFAAGRLSPNAMSFVSTHPAADKLCVVAQGEGYVINTTSPQDWQEIALRPIMGALASGAAGLIVLHDHTRFVALGATGVAWKTPSVSWDGIQNARVHGDRVLAEVWDSPRNAFVPVRIALAEGTFEGGASPAL
jgi:hypothetical protein